MNMLKTNQVKAPLSATRSVSRAAGFTLIEMMIGLSLGLVLVASAVTVFSGSRKSVDLNTALTDIQDSARFAMDTITRDIRMAGFQGCVDINTASAKILSDDAPTDNYFNTAVSVSLIENAGTWNPSAPMGFTIPDGKGAPVPGTHAISAQFGSAVNFTFAPLATVDADIVLDVTNSGLVNGDLALISNCQVADIFTITSASGATLQHSTSSNNDSRFSAPYGLAGANNRPRVMRFEGNIYFIGDTQRLNGAGNKIFSLYKQTLPYTAKNTPIEMIEGVANMQIKVGIRNPDETNDRTLQFLDPEDTAGLSGRIEVVQIGLLMQSYDPILEQTDDSTYQLAGNELDASPAPVDSSKSYASDKRLKLAFNSTVKVRNRR